MASWKSAVAPLQTPSSPSAVVCSSKPAACTTAACTTRSWSPYSKFNTPQLLQLAYSKRSEILELGGVGGSDQLRRELLNVNLIENLRDRMLLERMNRKRTSGSEQKATLKKQKSVFIDGDENEEAMAM